MKKTKLSFYYLFGYQSLTGIGLLLFPQQVLKLLFSTGQYDSTFVQLSGTFMIALSIIVFQLIRHEIEVFYPTTFVVRLFIISVITWFYFQTKDPFFIVLFVVVAIGIILTASTYFTEKAKASESPDTYRNPI